jgi:hypothetical protein
MLNRADISVVRILRAIICIQLLLAGGYVKSQTCSDPANVIYGVTNAGNIHAIDVNTGAAGTAINPTYPGNAPDQSNGLAYNPVDGKFYYFKRIPSSTITEFVSFDPATNIYTVLASPATSNAVYSGTISNDGTGYYCWDTQGTLFYYRFSNNTWTTITSNIKDQFGKDVDSIIRLHYSGDGAIDGNGNLWLMPSSATRYGLFRLNFPLPTTAVASVTVEQVIPMTPSSTTFVGISFTITGQIFMSTSSGNLYRLEANLSLTLMSTLTTNMADLTSCNFPLSVLSSVDYDFTASAVNGSVSLVWKPSMQQGSLTYIVERSTDNRTWTAIAKGGELNYSFNRISFIDDAPLAGKNYYRIRIINAVNRVTYSTVRMVSFDSDNISLWPNPVSNYLLLKNGGEKAEVTIYNEAGIKIKTAKIISGLNYIEFKWLPRARYFVRVTTSAGKMTTYKVIKK